MTKNELIAAIHDRLAGESLPVKRASIEAVLEAAAHVITTHFACADDGIDAEAVLPGLGKLKTSTRAARVGRNPQTGAEIQIPSRIVVKFAAAKALDEALNPT